MKISALIFCAIVFIHSCKKSNSDLEIDSAFHTSCTLLEESIIDGEKGVQKKYGTLKILAQSEIDQIRILNTRALLEQRRFQLDSAIQTLKLGNQKTKQGKFNFLSGQFKLSLGKAYIDHGDYSKSLFYLSKAKQFYTNPATGFEYSEALINEGIAHKNLGHLDSSADSHYGCLKIKEHLEDSFGISRALLNLSNVFIENSQYKKCIQFLRKGIGYCPGNDLIIANYCYALSSVYLHLSKKDSIEHFSDRALELFNEQHDNPGVARVLELKAVHASSNNINEEAALLYSQSLEIYKEEHDTLGICYNYFNYGDLLFKMGKFKRSTRMLRTCNKILSNTDIWQLKTDLLKSLSRLYRVQQNSDSAYMYLSEYVKANDSLRTKQNSENIDELNIKYRTQKIRADKIQAELERDKEKLKSKGLLNISITMVALFIVLILIGILIRLKIRAKQQLAAKNNEIKQQKIDDLIKEKKIDKIIAIMDGQENERTRIARELHDGLGGLLAAVKHRVLEDIGLNKSEQQFSEGIQLLDEASLEVRRISHNMASNVLSKFGLSVAIKDFIAKIVKGKSIEVELKLTGADCITDENRNMHIYRIIQELINNLLKHAQASKISLQLLATKDILNIMMEDNGIGFKQTNKSDGMGLSNLKARVNHLQANIEIDSDTGHGTTIIIDIPISEA